MYSATHLTPNFSKAEFFRGTNPTDEQISTMLAIAEDLEKARAIVGPIIISSSIRSLESNKAAGGVAVDPKKNPLGSAHLYNAPGRGAVDLKMKGKVTHLQLAQTLMKVSRAQKIILERCDLPNEYQWVHVQYLLLEDTTPEAWRSYPKVEGFRGNPEMRGPQIIQVYSPGFTG